MNFEALRKRMQALGVTLSDMSAALGISDKTICTRMRGQTSFTQREICLLARLLRLDHGGIGEIFFDEKVS